MARDYEIYDAFTQKRAQFVGDMMREANGVVRRKERDERGLEAIDHGLRQIRGAAPSDALNAYCDRCWALALEMFGS